MNPKQVAILVVILLFGALTCVPLYEYGYFGIFELVLANSATVQVSVDPVIALSLLCVWIWSDAKECGISPVPFILITVLTGSFGPLLYFFRRSGLRHAVAASP
jgi:hypothetical protein